MVRRGPGADDALGGAGDPRPPRSEAALLAAIRAAVERLGDLERDVHEMHETLDAVVMDLAEIDETLASVQRQQAALALRVATLRQAH